MILETILSSSSADGIVNLAPIGIHVPNDCLHLSELREVQMLLYPGSRTYSNLKEIPEGVVNLTDDIVCFVDTALFSRMMPVVPSKYVLPARMAAAKAVCELSITSFDESTCPAQLSAKVLVFEESGTFSGFCRAQGAILDALVAVTRLQWISEREIQESWQRCRDLVLKTGGIRELEALQRISSYLAEQGVSLPSPRKRSQLRVIPPGMHQAE